MKSISSKKAIRKILIENKGRRVFWELLADSNLLLEAIMQSMDIEDISDLHFQVTSLRHNTNMVMEELGIIREKEWEEARKRTRVRMQVNKEKIRNR